MMPALVTAFAAFVALSALPGLAGGPLSIAGSSAPKRSWGPEQALGPPDTSSHADAVTAWATWKPDEAGEWLELESAREVEVAEVRIFETFNPGAVSRVLATSPNRDARVIFSGQYSPTPRAISVLSFRAPSGVRTRFLRVELASERVAGWNEIDAVELVGADGSRQWASGARASSSYADGAPPDALAALVGKPVRVHPVGGTSLDGRVAGFGPDWVKIVVDGASGGKEMVVLKASVTFFEPR